MASNSNEATKTPPSKSSLIYPPFPTYSKKQEERSEDGGKVHIKSRKLVTAHYFIDANIPDSSEQQANIDFLSFDTSQYWEHRESTDESLNRGHDYNYSRPEDSVSRSNLKYNNSKKARDAFDKSLETYWNSRNFSARPSVRYSPEQTECILKFLEEKFNNGDKQMARTCYNSLKSHLTYSDTRMFEFRAVLYPEHKKLIDLNFLIMRTIKSKPLSDSGKSCWIYRDLGPLTDNDSRLQGHARYDMAWKKKTSTTLYEIFQELGGIDGVVHWLENFNRVNEEYYSGILLAIRNLLVAGIENSDQLFAEHNFATIYRTLLAEVNTRLEEIGEARIEEPKVKENKIKAFVDSCSSFVDSCSSFFGSSSSSNSSDTRAQQVHEASSFMSNNKN